MQSVVTGTAGRSVVPTGDPVLVAVVGTLLVVAPVFATDAVGLTTIGMLCWFLMAGVHTAATVLSWRVSSAPDATDPVRRVWRGIAVACACFLVGDVVQLVLVALTPVTPVRLLGGVFQASVAFLGSVVIVVVLLAEPLRLTDRGERLRWWLDVSLVLVFAVAISATTTQVPSQAGSARVVAASLLGSGVFVVGVFAVVKTLFAAQRPTSRPAGAALGVATATEAVLQGVGNPLTDAGRVAWVLWLHIGANALLVVAARLQQRATAAGGAAAPPRRFRLLPVLAVVLTNGLLVATLATRPLDARTWVVVGGAVASTALVLVRQAEAVLRTESLLASLDARVHQLGRALAERDSLADQLRHLAHHDELTGLANRRGLVERLGPVLRPTADGDVVLVVVDLDDFKPVNDVHGHATGDLVLAVVADRLRGCAGDGDLVARLGGDEFALLLRGRSPDADGAAREVVAAVARPVVVPNGTARVTASAGAVVLRPGATVDDVLHAADVAMYAAKQAGKNRYVVHSDALVSE